MDANTIIWIVTLLVTFVAAGVDWRSRRIPNWLTVPGLVSAVTLHAVLGGWHGALFAAEGAGLALLLLLPLVLMRALGAGDWKLMGVVGAFLGPILFLFVLFGSILTAGLMAMVQMMRARRAADTFRNLIVLIRGFVVFGVKPNPQISLDNPKLLKLPFGIAVAAATLICFCAAHWSV